MTEVLELQTYVFFSRLEFCIINLTRIKLPLNLKTTSFD